MNQYQKLIAAGKIQECIDAFLEMDGDVYEQTILLSARWVRNKRANLSGALDLRDYTVARNQIVSALSQIALGIKGSSSVNSPNAESEISSQYTRENILALIQHFSRRNPEASEQFEQCLAEYDSYQKAKTQFAGHDATGRQRVRMQADFEIIYNSALNVKADNFEEEIAEIQKLLTSARVPTVQDLTTAYAIASGLGYINAELERLLELPVHTNETRIKITEALEAYLKSL
jgi:hypothetical protein